MKKVLTLAVVACMAFVMPAQAQIKFGAKAGLNLTSMSFSESGVKDAVSNNAGFFIGPTLKVTVPVVGLSVDGSLLFDQRSAKVKSSNETIKSQSIQIPVNVRYGFGLSSIVNLFAFAGPQFGFNIGSKEKIIDAASSWTLKSSNLSANFGIGATVLSKFQVTVNYNVALGKTGEYNLYDGAKKLIDSYDGKANAWQLGAAYYF